MKDYIANEDYENPSYPKVCMAVVIEEDEDDYFKYFISFNHSDFLYYDDILWIDVLWTSG